MTDRERYEHGMWVALMLARMAQKRGERPFGCTIYDPDWRLIGRGSGSETPTDPTAHSEIAAIRMACKARGGLLRGCTLISTHECCSMCSGAVCHSKVSTVVWGSSRADLPWLFRRLSIPAEERLRDTSRPPVCVPHVLRDECVALFDDEVRALRSPLVRASAE